MNIVSLLPLISLFSTKRFLSLRWTIHFQRNEFISIIRTSQTQLKRMEELEKAQSKTNSKLNRWRDINHEWFLLFLIHKPMHCSFTSFSKINFNTHKCVNLWSSYILGKSTVCLVSEEMTWDGWRRMEKNERNEQTSTIQRNSNTTTILSEIVWNVRWRRIKKTKSWERWNTKKETMSNTNLSSWH